MSSNASYQYVNRYCYAWYYYIFSRNDFVMIGEDAGYPTCDINGGVKVNIF